MTSKPESHITYYFNFNIGYIINLDIEIGSVSELTRYENYDEIDQHYVVPPGRRVGILRQEDQKRAEGDTGNGIEDYRRCHCGSRLAVAQEISQPGVPWLHPTDPIGAETLYQLYTQKKNRNCVISSSPQLHLINLHTCDSTEVHMLLQSLESIARSVLAGEAS